MSADGTCLEGDRTRGIDARDIGGRSGTGREPYPLTRGDKEIADGSRSTPGRVVRAQTRNGAYAELLGAPANTEAVAAFVEKRDPDFSSIPGI